LSVLQVQGAKAEMMMWEIESGLLLGLQWEFQWEIESGLLLGLKWDFQWEIESGLLLGLQSGLQLDWLLWEIELGLQWEIMSA
jgi:hypothetical protein